MPSLRRKAAPAPPPAPADWLPQQFGGRNFRAVADPIIEPHWSGVRVLARVGSGRVRLTDEDGYDCTADFEEIARAIGAAALAGELVLDGVLTVEPSQVSTGITRPVIQAPSAAEMMTGMVIGSRRHRLDEPGGSGRALDPDRPIAFVAVDLLSIDGTALIDLPLLERKRLLDGSLATGELVRITPFVRAPGGPFIGTWQASGLRRVAYKGINSRYLPGDKNPAWASITIPSQPLR